MAKEFPKCGRSDCVACEKGYCTILVATYPSEDQCKFFKTHEQVEKEKAYCLQRKRENNLDYKEKNYAEQHYYHGKTHQGRRTEKDS